MSDKTDTSGPAFPSGLPVDEYGLTKREFFAAMAMQGELSAQPEGGSWDPHDLAKLSVEYADALIAEISRGGDATDR